MGAELVTSEENNWCMRKAVSAFEGRGRQSESESVDVFTWMNVHINDIHPNRTDVSLNCTLIIIHLRPKLKTSPEQL